MTAFYGLTRPTGQVDTLGYTRRAPFAKPEPQTAQPAALALTCEDRRWLMREEGGARVLIEAASEDEVERQARDYMKLRVGEVRVHAADGSLRGAATPTPSPLSGRGPG